jgi:bifunctional non-homologous end joining protein LigD
MKAQTGARDKRTTRRAAAAGTAGPGSVKFTNVDKVMFPESGITKGDLLGFYLQIAPLLVPQLRDRPITVERLPDGIRDGAPRFWQKNTPDYYPTWIPRVNFPHEGKPVHYALVNDAHALAYFANQGSITFHVWFSRVTDIGRPDYVVFDLDPSGAPFGHVVRIAQTLHKLLDAAKVDSYPKTSGKSGVHILVPWRQAGGHDEARAWAMGIAKQAVAALPDIATTERSKAARGGRVYVDVMQNSQGRHAVPAYVVRATPEATVSTPLEWREVNAKLNPKKFTMDAVLKRVAKKGDLLPDFAASARPRKKRR